MESKRYVENFMKLIPSGGFQNSEIKDLVRELNQRLEECKGKKVYVDLPPIFSMTEIHSSHIV